MPTLFSWTADQIDACIATLPAAPAGCAWAPGTPRWTEAQVAAKAVAIATQAPESKAAMRHARWAVALLLDNAEWDDVWSATERALGAAIRADRGLATR